MFFEMFNEIIFLLLRLKAVPTSPRLQDNTQEATCMDRCEEDVIHIEGANEVCTDSFHPASAAEPLPRLIIDFYP